MSQTCQASKAGRPVFLDDVKRAEICALVTHGCSYRTAARYVGCTVQAISALSRRDADFGARLDKAIAQREIILVARLQKQSEQSWRATAHLLQTTVGGRFGGHVPTLDEEADQERGDEIDARVRAVQWPDDDAWQSGIPDGASGGDAAADSDAAADGDAAGDSDAASDDSAAHEPIVEPAATPANACAVPENCDGLQDTIQAAAEDHEHAEVARESQCPKELSLDVHEAVDRPRKPAPPVAPSRRAATCVPKGVCRKPAGTKPTGTKPTAGGLTPEEIRESMQALEERWRRRGPRTKVAENEAYSVAEFNAQFDRELDRGFFDEELLDED